MRHYFFGNISKKVNFHILPSLPGKFDASNADASFDISSSGSDTTSYSKYLKYLKTSDDIITNNVTSNINHREPQEKLEETHRSRALSWDKGKDQQAELDSIAASLFVLNWLS